MKVLLPRLILWVVAACYVFGAYQHVASIAGWHGFIWSEAPLKWQIMDVVYLALDIAVVVGFLLRWRIGMIAFLIAAVSQIILFTVLRSWIADVPLKYAPALTERSYLTTLVTFHLVTIVLVFAALRMGVRRKAGDGRLGEPTHDCVLCAGGLSSVRHSGL